MGVATGEVSEVVICASGLGPPMNLNAANAPPPKTRMPITAAMAIPPPFDLGISTGASCCDVAQDWLLCLGTPIALDASAVAPPRF